MKKLLLFFALILLFGCESILKNDENITSINCPTIFFSSENNVYPLGNLKNLDLDEFEYKAKLNNFNYSKGCFADNSKNYFKLNLLVLVEPINPTNKTLKIPLFAILYDVNNDIIEKQYFRITGELNYSSQTNEYQLTDLITMLNIISEKNEDISSISIGFVNIKNN